MHQNEAGHKNDPGTEPYPIDYEIGQDNVEILGMALHNPVFFISSVLIILFVTGTIMYPEVANTLLSQVKAWSLTNFDWFLMGSANFLLLFCIGLIFSPFGRIRLGGPLAKPEFSRIVVFDALCGRDGNRPDVLGSCRTHGLFQWLGRHTFCSRAF